MRQPPIQTQRSSQRDPDGMGCELVLRENLGLIEFERTLCNDPTIGSYNNYHLSPNGIPRGSERWYGLVYLVYKNAGLPKGKA